MLFVFVFDDVAPLARLLRGIEKTRVSPLEGLRVFRSPPRFQSAWNMIICTWDSLPFRSFFVSQLNSNEKARLVPLLFNFQLLSIKLVWGEGRMY